VKGCKTAGGVEDIDGTAYVLLFFDLENQWKWPSKSGTCFLDKDSQTNSWLDSQPPNAGHKMAWSTMSRSTRTVRRTGKICRWSSTARGAWLMQIPGHTVSSPVDAVHAYHHVHQLVIR
jgi:hypothetical protein